MKEESITNSLRPPQQCDDPLHGVTLEMILKELVARYGWEKLGQEGLFAVSPTSRRLRPA
jgi:uncharacterized protein (DUF2132 family)